jgi:hypothetical protein
MFTQPVWNPISALLASKSNDDKLFWLLEYQFDPLIVTYIDNFVFVFK